MWDGLGKEGSTPSREERMSKDKDKDRDDDGRENQGVATRERSNHSFIKRGSIFVYHTGPIKRRVVIIGMDEDIFVESTAISFPRRRERWIRHGEGHRDKEDMHTDSQPG
jgi:hypothetical protein